jgi:hypothetical protein
MLPSPFPMPRHRRAVRVLDLGIDEAIGADAACEHDAKIVTLGRLVEPQPPGSSAM